MKTTSDASVAPFSSKSIAISSTHFDATNKVHPTIARIQEVEIRGGRSQEVASMIKRSSTQKSVKFTSRVTDARATTKQLVDNEGDSTVISGNKRIRNTFPNTTSSAEKGARRRLASQTNGGLHAPVSPKPVLDVTSADEDDSLMQALESIPTHPGMFTRTAMLPDLTEEASVDDPDQLIPEPPKASREKKLLPLAAKKGSTSGSSQKKKTETKPSRKPLGTSSSKQNKKNPSQEPSPAEYNLSLSPSEELTLLAVKNKPNSPDRDSEQAPQPPRISHKRAAVKQMPIRRTTSRDFADENDENEPEVRSDIESKRGDESTAAVIGSPKSPVETSFAVYHAGDSDSSGTSSTHSPLVSASLKYGTSQLPSNVLAAKERLTKLREKRESLRSCLQIESKRNAPASSGSQALPDAYLVGTAKEESSICSASTSDTSITPAENPEYSFTSLRSQQPTNFYLNKRPNSRNSTFSISTASLSRNVGALLQASTNDEESGNNSNPVSSVSSGHNDQGEQTYNESRPSNLELAAKRVSEIHRKARQNQEVADILDQRDKSSDQRMLCYGFGILLAIAATVITLYFLVFNGEQDLAGTRITAENTYCNNSMRLDNLTGSTITGEILKNVEGNISADCMVEATDAYTLWYTLEGNGNFFRAATCDGSDDSEDSDTQVLVFSGSCDKMMCIGGSDALCGSHGSVGWLATAGEDFYVVVKGLESSNQGNFTLTLNEFSVANDNCRRSQEVTQLNRAVIGSTRNHSLEDSFPGCEASTGQQLPSSWYRIEGDGSLIWLSVSTDVHYDIFDYPVDVSVYVGESCSSLNCVVDVLPSMQQNGSYTFQSVVGQSYYVAVRDWGHFFWKDGLDYVLHIESSPSNSVCDTSELLQVGSADVGGVLVRTNHTSLPKCPYIANQRLTWYTVLGTGDIMVAEVTGLPCGGGESQIYVFDGSRGCANLDCVAFHARDCSAGDNRIQSHWISKADQVYYLGVTSSITEEEDMGATSTEEEFTIAVREGVLSVPNDFCETATSVEIPSATFGSSVDSTAVLVDACPTRSKTRGIWYNFVGNGERVTASLCNDGTTFDTQLYVFVGETCDTMTCVGFNEDFCGNKSMYNWFAETDVRYYILVSGFNNEVGDFELVIT